MADEILIPGTPGTTGCDSLEPKESPNYLIKDNYLSELETELDKEIARENLGVYSKQDTYTKTEVDNNIRKQTGDQMKNHLLEDDPHQIMPKVDSAIENLVRRDGTTPFIAPQTGVDPILDLHLATKRFVTNLLNSHLSKQDPHNIMLLVREALQAYVEKSQVYLKKELYTKREVDRLFQPYVTKDGSVPFTRPQVGVTPTLDNHLATKKYTDQAILSHLVSADPHGFIAILNQRLAKYYSRNETYSKVETYSRAQIDAMVYRLVADAARSALEEHVNASDPHRILEIIQNKYYITRDGSTPFIAPQQGVDAVNPQELVTLQQVTALLQNLGDSIPNCEWITSGPTEATVGNIEINTKLPDTMSIQEVLDAIFYGKGISLAVPEYVNIGDEIPVTICIHGSSALLDRAELLRDGVLVASYYREDFEKGCISTDLDIIQKDTEITFQAYYINGATYEEIKLVKASLPIFVGLLPKWKFGSTISYKYLEELQQKDGDNNIFYSIGDNIRKLIHTFNFRDIGLQHPFVVIPVTYPNLTQMSIMSQQFGVDAFDVIDMIPLQVPNTTKDPIYKIYIYKQALSNLDQEVKFKFA